MADPPGTTAVPEVDRTDLRLVPPALAGWIVAWLAPLASVQFAAIAALALLGAGGCACVGAGSTSRRTLRDPHAPAASRRPPPRPARPRDPALTGAQGWAWSVAAALIVAAAVLSVAALHAARARGSPVDELAAERAVVAAELRITGDARAVAVTGVPVADPLWVVDAEVVVIMGRGQRTDASAPVVVLTTDPGWSSLTPSTVVQVTGRLSPNDRLTREVAVLRVASSPEVVRRASALQRAAQSVRIGLRTAVSDLPPDARGLLPGLVVGDESLMPPDLIADAKTTGLTHLTAVSGTNVAIVLGVVLAAARWGGLRARALPTAGAMGLAGFVVLARPDPSVLRASVMGLVVVLGLVSGARRRRLSALSAAVVILLLVDPWLARSYGFALSVLASGAIVLLVPGWTDSWSRVMPRPFAAALAVPVAAQLVCGPVVVMLSEQVSVVAVVANLLAAPAVVPATVLGVMVAVVAVVAPRAAELLAHVAGLPVGWVAVVARWFADRPYAAVDWPSGVSGAVALAALTLVGVVCTPSLVRRPQLLVAVVVLPALTLWGVRTAGPPWPASDWRVVACDVGQGDALVVAVAPGRAIVVDTGPEPTAVDACLRRLQVTDVPLLVLTHDHIDHVGGVLGVLAGRRVGTIATRPGGSIGVPTEGLQAEIARADGVQALAAGWTATVQGVRLDVLWPPAGPEALLRLDPAESAENNASLVIRVTDPSGVRSLLTGDIEPSAQRAIVRSGADLTADVLKVPHHGSRHQEAGFLRAAGADVALVSAGADNDYGHPSEVTLDVIEAAGARVFRTDTGGMIAVSGTPQRLRVSVSADRAPDERAAHASNDLPPHGGWFGGTAAPADLLEAVATRSALSAVATMGAFGAGATTSAPGAVATAGSLPGCGACRAVAVGSPWHADARWRARAPPATATRPTARWLLEDRVSW